MEGVNIWVTSSNSCSRIVDSSSSILPIYSLSKIDAQRENTNITYNRDWPYSSFQCPHANLPDAFLTTTYLINMTHVWSLGFVHTLDYATLRVFSCARYSWLRSYVKHKLDPLTKKCVFMGYSLNHKGYRHLDPSTGKASNFSFTKLFFPHSHTTSILGT